MLSLDLAISSGAVLGDGEPLPAPDEEWVASSTKDDSKVWDDAETWAD